VLGQGGFLDTVLDGETGVLFAEPTPSSLAAAIRRVESTPWDVDVLRARADEFSEGRFAERLRAVLAAEASGR
jgi:glycosyltransferase involved in cell wall biosynthesis